MNLLLCHKVYSPVKGLELYKKSTRRSHCLSAAAMVLALSAAGQAQALSCSASADSWGDGYVVNVSVTNDSSSPISNWAVDLKHAGATQVSASWSANVSASGSVVTASNVGWNGGLAPGQSASFGYQGSHGGSFQAPTCSVSGGAPATPAPTPMPTSQPTAAPTPSPTEAPTPTAAPTAAPTSAPTPEPTAAPTATPTMAPTPQPTVSPNPGSSIVIQENESGFCEVDGTIDDNNSGYTGNGFANTENTQGAGITWSVNVADSGNYDVQFRYASGASDNRFGRVFVNNSDQASIDFNGTGAWTRWDNSEVVTLFLNAGQNQLVVSAGTGGGLPNIDSLSVFGEGVSPGNCTGSGPSPTAAPTPTSVPSSQPTATPTPKPTQAPTPRPNPGSKLRVMMSSDIGGTDNDDQQSMAHFLVYADMWDVEGLISSPWGRGRTADILDAIGAYEKDYNNLRSYSADYPSPDYLRSIAKQGATSKAPASGYRSATEGSEWIAEVAMRDDPRPLWLTVWGGIEDLAQALRDHPEIESRLRVYWIAGPNRRNSPNASKYIAENHKNLWIIEADETYRGFFNGGNMSGDLSNSRFPRDHIAGHGALGDYLMSHRTTIKMGDTPAVLYTLDNEVKNPGDPSKPGWGGAFIPCGGDRPNCWKDDPSKSSNGYDGAATVNVHREAFLRDFQQRMDRAQSRK